MSQICSRCKKKSLYEQFKRKEERDRQLAEAKKNPPAVIENNVETAVDNPDNSCSVKKTTRKKTTQKVEVMQNIEEVTGV